MRSRRNANGRKPLRPLSRRALIAGAGIGGLSCALALAQSGFEVVIYERAAALAEFGAAVQLSPNATRVLCELGALENVRRYAFTPLAIHLRRWRNGAALTQLSLADAERRWGAPYWVIHRAHLQRALLRCVEARPEISLNLGAEIAGVSASQTGVTVGVKRGLLSTRESADLIIGADGLRSLVRERLGLGERNGAEFSGRIAYRALVEAKALAPQWREPAITLQIGPKAHLVHYPFGDGSAVNIVAVIEAARHGAEAQNPWDGEADGVRLMRAFARWSPQARALLAAAPSWRAFALYDRPCLASFAHERIALAGDAAHPMTPFLAQGAAQAIEDAGALGGALRAQSDIAQALAAYSAARAPRAARVQREARAQARLYHMRGPLALARNLTMRAFGPERLLKRYDWLYGA